MLQEKSVSNLQTSPAVGSSVSGWTFDSDGNNSNLTKSLLERLPPLQKPFIALTMQSLYNLQSQIQHREHIGFCLKKGIRLCKTCCGTNGSATYRIRRLLEMDSGYYADVEEDAKNELTKALHNLSFKKFGNLEEKGVFNKGGSQRLARYNVFEDCETTPSLPASPEKNKLVTKDVNLGKISKSKIPRLHEKSILLQRKRAVEEALNADNKPDHFVQLLPYRD